MGSSKPRRHTYITPQINVHRAFPIGRYPYGAVYQAMAHRIPAKFEFYCNPSSQTTGYFWRMKAKGDIWQNKLASGYAADRKQARIDAWHALEEMGLVTDGDE